jgi:raffinose/stachyose/melibiose transport system substrate-binding protein
MRRKLVRVFLVLTAVLALTLTAQARSKLKAQTVTLKIWHNWVSDTDANKRAFKKIVNNFCTANPNIKIEADGIENQSYKYKIKTAVAANEMPDLFYTWGAGFSKPFVEAGKILALDSYLRDGTKRQLLPGTLTYFTYNNKVYGLPLYMWCGVLYCNQEMFAKNNLKLPDTYQELLTAVKAFRAKEITPITVGGKDRWPVMHIQNILALRTGGAKLNVAALNKKASFNQPAFIKSAALLSELVKAKAFNDGALGLTRDEAQALFLQGQIPMYYHGSWVAGMVEKDGSPVKGKIVAKPFPMVEGGKGKKNEFLGGAVNAFMISARTKHPKEAVKFLKYLSQNMSKESYLSGGNLPAWKVDVDTSKVNPVMLQIAQQTKDAKSYILAWDTFMDGATADTLLNMMQEILAGVLTPEQFAKRLQEANR